jgi:hypothetical protein
METKRPDRWMVLGSEGRVLMNEPMKGCLALAIWMTVGIIVLPPIAYCVWHLSSWVFWLGVWWVQWWAY